MRESCRKGISLIGIINLLLFTLLFPNKIKGKGKMIERKKK